MKRCKSLHRKELQEKYPFHIPVMLREFVETFKETHLTSFYEGTVGAGGHAKAMLESHPEIELYIGCDKDPRALDLAKQVLAPWKEKVTLIHGDFSMLDEHITSMHLSSVDGFFLTLESPRCS